MALSEQQRKANRRLGWALGGLALAFAAAFVVKVFVLGA
jgi:hypothetical protein